MRLRKRHLKNSQDKWRFINYKTLLGNGYRYIETTYADDNVIVMYVQDPKGYYKYVVIEKNTLRVIE